MLSYVSLTACQFVFWTHWGNDCSWRKTILLLSELRLGLSGILDLVGPDCLFENTLHDTFLDFVVWVSQKESTWSMQRKKKKRRSTCRIRRNNTAVSTRVLKARHLWTNLALSCVAGTHSFEKQYKNRLMQNQAMEITAGRAMRHRAILGDFASPDSQIAMETSIIGCRIARFCFSVTGLLESFEFSLTIGDRVVVLNSVLEIKWIAPLVWHCAPLQLWHAQLKIHNPINNRPFAQLWPRNEVRGIAGWSSNEKHIHRSRFQPAMPRTSFLVSSSLHPLIWIEYISYACSWTSLHATHITKSQTQHCYHDAQGASLTQKS